LSEFNFLETGLVPVDFGVHNVVNNLNLLQPLGIERDHALEHADAYDFAFSDEERVAGRLALAALGFDSATTIAIHPGSTNSPAALRRRWVPERWARVCQELVDSRKLNVLVFSGPEEGDLGARITSLSARPGAVILANARGFSAVLQQLSACRMLLNCDNGFGHLAVALGIHVVSLFAVTDHTWSGPYSSRLLRVVLPPSYEPWHRYELKRGVPAFARDAMLDIDAASVLDAVDATLSETGGDRT
jgi:ADP-heptose:LPS heptosyltransferase